jgi:hypothetical protein
MYRAICKGYLIRCAYICSVCTSKLVAAICCYLVACIFTRLLKNHYRISNRLYYNSVASSKLSLIAISKRSFLACNSFGCSIARKPFAQRLKRYRVVLCNSVHLANARYLSYLFPLLAGTPFRLTRLSILL